MIKHQHYKEKVDAGHCWDCAARDGQGVYKAGSCLVEKMLLYLHQSPFRLQLSIKNRKKHLFEPIRRQLSGDVRHLFLLVGLIRGEKFSPLSSSCCKDNS